MGRYDPNPAKKNTATTFFVVAVIVAITFGIVGNYYVLKRRHSTEVEISKQDITDEISVPNNSIKKEQNLTDIGLGVKAPGRTEAIAIDPKALDLPTVLPDLLSSDDAFRQTLMRASADLAPWLNTDRLIRRYVIIANDFSQGQRIANHMSFIRSEGPFTVQETDSAIFIDPDSYNRYNRLAQAIQIINAKAAVIIFKTFRPLMLQVFAEFSYPPDITLESIVKKAAAEIIAAPVIEQPIALVRPSVYYKFADPSLEALNPVQKQMLRMGPQNTRVIQVKLREFMVEFAKENFNS